MIRTVRYLIMIVMTILTISSFAISNDSLVLLNSHKYVEFLQQSKPIRESVVKEPANKFDDITSIAIALEKTSSWDEQPGKDILDGLKSSPDALRYLNVLKLLIKGDTQSIVNLYQGKEPESMSMLKASNMLSEHGFKLASDVICVFVPIDPRSRMVKFLSIPKDKRVFVETALFNQVKDNTTLRWFADSALDIYLHPIANDIIDPKESFEYAMKIGEKQNLVSFDTVKKLYEAGKKDDAMQMISKIIIANPNDATIQKEAINLLTGMGQASAADMVYQQAMVNVSEFKRRTMRMENLESMQRNKQVDEINKFQVSEDALIAGDAFLVSKKYNEASQKYLNIVINDNIPLERRVTAWVGLFDANPEQAMKIHKELFFKIENVDKKSVSIFVNDIFYKIYQKVNDELADKRADQWPGEQYICLLSSVKGWGKKLSEVVTLLIKIDPATSLRNTEMPSYRCLSAKIYSLADEPDKAAEILYRVVNYQIDPPPGGWKIHDGTPTPDYDQPRKYITPEPREMKELIIQALDEISIIPKADERLTAVGILIANNVEKQLSTVTKNTPEKEITNQLTILAGVMKFSVKALNPYPKSVRFDVPSPTPEKVDMKKFTLIDTIVRKVFTNDIVAFNAMDFIRDGMQVSLRVSTNPELMSGLTDLTVYILKRCIESGNKIEIIEPDCKYLSEYIGTRKDYDMKSYGTRILNSIKK